MIFKANYQKKEEGLTIVELLATIAILVSAVMVILVLGDRAVSQAGFYSAQTQATFLAKEGMEFVTHHIEEIKSGTSTETTYWLADHISGVQLISSSDCYNRLLINANGFYNYSSGNSSPFSRCITAVPAGGNLEVVVDLSFDYRGSNNVKLYRVFTD